MNQPIKSPNQIGMKNYSSNREAMTSSAKKPTTNTDSSAKKSVPKIPMQSSNFGKPVPSQTTKKTTTTPGVKK